ncbi:MAG: GTP-binding protein [Oscillospiraceae bacterium]|jgi:G3E family GTPase|nr:GTP-binding protein [Oscillospiraceae bacterium]
MRKDTDHYMAKMYVITGFLGAGKTTFLKEFARLLTGEKLAVLVNEFGKEDVDSKLLRELNAAMEEVHSGSIFCACRIEQFSDALSRLLKDNPDIILVETSGLSDPTRIRTLLAEHSNADKIDYRGCLCIADAVRFEKVYSTALVCGKQLDICDAVIINKTDIASDEQKQKTLELIKNHRPDVPVYLTSHGRIQPEWLYALRKPTGTKSANSYHVKDVSLQSRLVTIRDTFPMDKLMDFLCCIAPASFRIKGFVQLQEGVFFVDAVGQDVKLKPWDKEVESLNRLVVLAGRGLPLLSTLKEAGKSFNDYILSIE